MAFADVDGVRLFFTDDGEGDPLLLVHGWSCDSHDWSWQLEAFVAAGYRVIAVDNRGHGRSSIPEGPITPRIFAHDLATLLDQLDTGPVVAMGHSLGGLIVSALAVEHPGRVRAVVAVDPAYGVDGEMKDMLVGVLAGLRSPAGMETASAVFGMMEAPATPAHLQAWHRRRVLGTPLPVIVDTLSGIYEADDQFGTRPASDEYLARRTCPVLAIHADPERGAVDATTFTDPLSRSISWEGSGHWLHQERPAEFNALVLAWIEQLPPA